MLRRCFASLSLLAVLLHGTAAHADEADFAKWVENFKEEAVKAGISQPVIDAAFTGLEPDDAVIQLDQKQPENKLTLEQYLHNTINARRIHKGREMLAFYAEPLKRISQKYGVQPKYIVALWGIESDYGQHPGNFSVVRSLATLAYEGRRAELFSKELVSALAIIEAENIAPEELTGSWAGAMGGCQFMPSTYRTYAADGNGDGKRDIWKTPEDVFASIANYLHNLGWNPAQQWGGAAVADDDFSDDIDKARSGHYWSKHGVSFTSGAKPKDEEQFYAITVGSDGDAYLVSENFKALLNWNRSRYFAAAVGTLADAIGDEE